MEGEFILNGGPFDGHKFTGSSKGVLYFVSLDPDAISGDLPKWVEKAKLRGIPVVWSIDKDPERMAYRYEYEGQHHEGRIILQFKEQVLSKEVTQLRMNGEY